MTTFGQIMAGCRRDFGAKQRRFNKLALLMLKATPPQWMKGRSDELWEIYRFQERLLREGRIVWGFLVQANVQLFEPGTVDCPAAAIYSPDLYFDEQPQELGEISHALFAAKGKQVEDAELQRFSDTLADEMERLMKVRAPAALTGGREVFYTSIMVARKHLPERQLTEKLFPLLILPEATEATLILPAPFWPTGLRRLWTL